MVAQVARLVIGLGATAVLARMLTPQEFGYVAMVVAVVGLAELLRDFGLFNAAIQAPDLDENPLYKVGEKPSL